MSELSDTIIVLLASGQSRRFRRQDKMLADLCGKPLVRRTADTLKALEARMLIAVCPKGRSHVAELLEGDFVIATNDKPRAGIGRSIATGAKVAANFKPKAILYCLADMPFVEADTFRALRRQLDNATGVQIVHAGEHNNIRPPAIFSAECLEDLSRLDGDRGANEIIRSGNYASVGLCVPKPELRDIDTRDDLEIAADQWVIRKRYLPT